MITLATLDKATAQQVFDQVATHLLTQNKKSTRRNNISYCMYRGADGLKCAAGCLISDAEYTPEMEWKGWGNLIGSGIVPTTQHQQLVYRLQELHDDYTAKQWKKELIEVAERFKLNADVVTNFIGGGVYEFFETETGKDNTIVNLNDYGLSQQEEAINPYGYTLQPKGNKEKGLADIKELYPTEWEWIIAECIFESK